MNEIRVGAVNWDCSLPAETFFGYYQTRTLSPRKYRAFTPYYADIVGEDRIAYHRRSQAEFDRELCYAIEAGIDYFAYVYYPDQASREHISLSYADVSHRVYELTYARRMHASSKYRHKLGMALIVTPVHPLDDADIAELIAFLREPYYETVGGRPLIYVYQSANVPMMERILAFCRAEGVADPFFVPMVSSLPSDAASPLIGALSQYACVRDGITAYEDLCEAMIAQNRRRLGCGYPIIPLFTTGWNPSPRIDIPSPWVTYPAVDYAAIASPQALEEGARRLADWICDEARDAFVGHILTFAWNEFEEGAWICPTYDAEQHVNEARIAAFARISAAWKKRLTNLAIHN